MEGFSGGGSFEEGKGDGGLHGGNLKLWWNKWRWRRKNMMVRCPRSYCCCCCCCCISSEEGVLGF